MSKNETMEKILHIDALWNVIAGKPRGASSQDAWLIKGNLTWKEACLLEDGVEYRKED